MALKTFENSIADQKIIPGVFCDVYGTLLGFLGENMNSDVLELLNKHETDGKTVTLWTGGEIKEAEEALEGFGITNWKVVSKYRFANSAVEIAIDDMEQEKFFKDYKIRAATFIQRDWKLDE